MAVFQPGNNITNKSRSGRFSLTFWRDTNPPQHYNSYGTYYAQLFSLWGFPQTHCLFPRCSISSPKLPDVWKLAVQPDEELLSTEAPACSLSKPPEDQAAVSELNLWPRSHFHLISLEQWSQTSVSGTEPLSICCSGQPSAEKHRQQLDVQPSEQRNVHECDLKEISPWLWLTEIKRTKSEISWKQKLF